MKSMQPIGLQTNNRFVILLMPWLKIIVKMSLYSLAMHLSITFNGCTDSNRSLVQIPNRETHLVIIPCNIAILYREVLE